MNKKRIALGAWAWGEGDSKDQVFGNNTNLESLRPVFDYAMSKGLNIWDTALVYGMGASERILGECFKRYSRESYIISTKFTPQLASYFDNSMQKMLDESKRNLNADHIDIYWIHNPVGIEKWVHEIIPIAKSGQIGQIGVSNHNLEELKYVQGILNQAGLRVAAVQNHFSLLNRTSESGGLLAYCKENDIDFYSYMVLEQGALSGKYDASHPFPSGSDRADTYNRHLKSMEPLIEKLRELGEIHNVNAAQIAISYAIHKNTIPIVGVTKMNQIDDAESTINISLSESEINELETIADECNINVIRGWEKSMS